MSQVDNSALRTEVFALLSAEEDLDAITFKEMRKSLENKLKVIMLVALVLIELIYVVYGIAK